MFFVGQSGSPLSCCSGADSNGLAATLTQAGLGLLFDHFPLHSGEIK
jgi:hypothetical protein